ncbi:MAG: hypothetical protein M1832_003766 [Thelocarpon impressellum]|nr:MAG: hypothetical protein M1832_003766 [Thelocarpon impressellum]
MALLRFLMLQLLLVTAGAHRACFTADGRLSADDAPCDSTSGESFCCKFTEQCLAGGMCQQKSRDVVLPLYFRATCTDRTWKSPSCSKLCDETPMKDFGPTMQSCGDSKYCCNANTTDTACCSSDVMPLFLIPKNDITDAKNATGTPTPFEKLPPGGIRPLEPQPEPGPDLSPAVPAVPAKPTKPAAPGLSVPAKAGIAAGIVAFTSVNAVLAILFFRRRRRRRRGATHPPTGPFHKRNISYPISIPEEPVMETREGTQLVRSAGWFQWRS